MVGALTLSLVLSASTTVPVEGPRMLTSLVQPDDDEEMDEDSEDGDESESSGVTSSDEDTTNSTGDEAGSEPEPELPAKQWQLHTALGGEFVVTRFSAGGPNIRFGAWRTRWKNKFMVGGGPVLHYSLLLGGGDQLHFLTLDGDLLIGGGKQGKFAVYGHLLVGGGIIVGSDGQTGLRLLLPGIRLAGGAGVHGWITKKVTLGGLVDFGYFGGLGVDAYLTLGYMFG